MSTQKSFLTRLFSRKPKQAALPLTEEKLIKSDFGTWTEWSDSPVVVAQTEAIASKHSPRKRVAYIPTNESPWVFIYRAHGAWRIGVYYLYSSRAEARKDAAIYSKHHHVRTRVVRAIIPTA